MREIRLRAARAGEHGTHVMTFEHLAARLSGGFTKPIDYDTLRSTIQQVLPAIDLGELDAIKLLPGMLDAAADTLQKACWRASICGPAPPTTRDCIRWRGSKRPFWRSYRVA